MIKSILRYVVSICIITLTAVVLIHCLALGAIKITNSLNDRYEPYYEAGERGISSPWYEDGYHIVDEGIIPEIACLKAHDNNVISIGSSLSIISFQPAMEALDKDFEYHFLVCGNGCWKSDRILYNLAKEADAIGADDIVKLEVSFSTFRVPSTTIVETTLDKWEKYTADNETCEVTKGTDILSAKYWLNEQLIRIQNIWELSFDAVAQYFSRANLDESSPVSSIIAPGNFKNNYYSYDAVAASCKIDDDMRLQMEELIEEISNAHDLVIELSPIPQGLLATDYGKEYNYYVDNELIPKLISNGIQYLDYRYRYEDSEFADGVHLGYNAGIDYTNELNKDLNNIINNK